MYITSERKLRGLLLLKSENAANQAGIIKSEENSIHADVLCDDQLYLSDTRIVQQRNYPAKKLSRKFICRSCSRSFQTRDLLREHKRTHTTFDLATKPASKTATDMHHMPSQINGGGGEDDIESMVLKVQFEDDQSFASSNISTDEAQTISNFAEASTGQEPKCRKRKTKKSLTRRKWTCNKCYEKFKVREELREHKKVHKVSDSSGENVRGEFICDFCGKICVTKQKIRQHMGSHDSTRTKVSYLCNVCGMWLSSKRNLNIHNRVVHIGEKKHKCPFCDRSFSSSQHLKIHINRHEGNYLSFIPKILKHIFDKSLIYRYTTVRLQTLLENLFHRQRKKGAYAFGSFE